MELRLRVPTFGSMHGQPIHGRHVEDERYMDVVRVSGQSQHAIHPNNFLNAPF